MRYCDCGGCAVDGGMAYLRIVGSNWESMAIEWGDNRYTSLYQMIEQEMRKTPPNANAIVQMYMDVNDEASIIPRLAIQQAAEWSVRTRRNTLGIICAMARAERDGVFDAP
jgi:hypothetical protein